MRPWNKGRKGKHVAPPVKKDVGTYVTLCFVRHPQFGTGRILEHRHVVQQTLGRKLRRREYVHHIDGDKHNNALKNLQVMSQKEHAKLHPRVCSLETAAKISAAKKGKPQPWARANAKRLKGLKRSAAFKRKVSEGMRRYVSRLPAGEMARRAKGERAKQRLVMVELPAKGGVK